MPESLFPIFSVYDACLDPNDYRLKSQRIHKKQELPGEGLIETAPSCDNMLHLWDKVRTYYRDNFYSE